MKKIMCFLAMALLLCVCFVGCSSGTTSSKNNTEEKVINESQVEEPKSQKEEGTCEDNTDWLIYKYSTEYQGIDNGLSETVGAKKFDDWCNLFWNEKRPMEDLQIFNFVRDFNISKEDFTKYCLEHDIYTQEQIDLIYSDDTEKVNEKCHSDLAVFKNGKIYTPKWLNTHTVEEWKAESLTKGDVEPFFKEWEIQVSGESQKVIYDDIVGKTAKL